MTLAFLNPSRSFDEARNAVLFVGHDGMFEVRFFIEIAALSEGYPRGTRMSESECLSAFDAKRGSIHRVAQRVYDRRRCNLNTLTAADFR
ncbi:MAG: DUF1488 domain-containing protein [Xanthobacteraceae bacterium]